MTKVNDVNEINPKGDSNMMFQIKHRSTGKVLFEKDTETLKLCVESAVISGADLRSADLRNADLSGADLSGADLRNAELSGADLRNADLRGIDLDDLHLRRLLARICKDGLTDELKATCLHQIGNLNDKSE